jgi:predicted transcriptional regulator
MAKDGVDIDLEKMANDFLKKYDNDKKKIYLSERQMERRQKREVAISNLSKKEQKYFENIFESKIDYDD